MKPTNLESHSCFHLLTKKVFNSLLASISSRAVYIRVECVFFFTFLYQFKLKIRECRRICCVQIECCSWLLPESFNGDCDLTDIYDLKQGGYCLFHSLFQENYNLQLQHEFLLFITSQSIVLFFYHTLMQ